MHIRTWRDLIIGGAVALTALAVVACSGSSKEVVVRASETGFTIVGTLGKETRFVLINDGAETHEAQVLALNGHTQAELKDALAQGVLPDWVTVVAKAGPAGAGTIATATAKTPDAEYVVVDIDHAASGLLAVVGSTKTHGVTVDRTGTQLTDAGGTAPPGETTVSGEQVKGRPVAQFFQATCATCHGNRRQGLVGPALTPARLTQPDAFYEDTVLNGRQGTAMPAWSKTIGLTPEDAKVIVHWLKSEAP